MTGTIEQYICLSVSSCKRLGFFKEGTVATGKVIWTQGGQQVAAITLCTNTGTVPYAVLRYRYRGENIDTPLTLRYQASNLNNGTGFYYFVCPVTGMSCRKLYLVNGRFVSRSAFRPLYRKQTESRTRRSGGLAYLDALADLEALESEKYRRFTYRGKLTPYGRKCERIARRASAMLDCLGGIVETNGGQPS